MRLGQSPRAGTRLYYYGPNQPTGRRSGDSIIVTMAAEPGRIDEATLRDLIEPVGDLDELDQACFHKGDDRWRQVGDEGWDHLFERTLVYLRTQLGYFFDYNIAEGNFGRLVRMYDPENRADVTVWFSGVVNARRENFWRTLSHPNLMELLRRIRHALPRKKKKKQSLENA